MELGKCKKPKSVVFRKENIMKEKDKLSFFAGNLSEQEIEEHEDAHDLFELSNNLFENEVAFSAFGDDCALRGTGILIDDPKCVLKLDLNKDKSFIKDASRNQSTLLENSHSVVIAHVRVVTNRHKYIDKQGKDRIFKDYGFIPILANSATAKRMLIRFGKGDHITFRGAFISKLVQSKDDSLIGTTAFYCLLREFNGYPIVKQQREMEEKLSDCKQASNNYHEQEITRPKVKKPVHDTVARQVNSNSNIANKFKKGGESNPMNKNYEEEIKKSQTAVEDTSTQKKSSETREQYQATKQDDTPAQLDLLNVPTDAGQKDKSDRQAVAKENPADDIADDLNMNF